MMRTRLMSVLCGGLVVSTAGIGLGQSVEGIEVDFTYSKTNVVVTITNRSGEDLDLEGPNQHRAIQFIVMSEGGDRLAPEGIAKVDPANLRLKLKAGASYDHKLDELAELALERGHYFPYLTGTGLFGYRLKPGGKYRVIAIYRPFGEKHEGVCSREKLVEILE